MKLVFNPFTGNFDYIEDVSGYVPYTGATDDVDLGNHTLTCGGSQSGISAIASGLVVNEDGGNTAYDMLRVETGARQNALLVDAVNDEVQVNSAFKLGGANPVDTIETVLTDDDTHLPTSGAVHGAIGAIDLSPYVKIDGSTNIEGVQTFEAGIYNVGDLEVNGVSEFQDEAFFNEYVEMYNGVYVEGGASIEGALAHSNGALYSTGTSGATPVSGGGTRMMWIPAKGAFRAGEVTSTQWDDVNIGDNSFAVGHNTRAIGDGSACFGATNYVTGDYAVGFGYSNSVSNNYAASFGRNNDVSAIDAVCFGYNNEASGTSAFCAGSNSEASGSYSFANGYACEASGGNSVSLGNSNTSSGSNSFSVGTGCTSSGIYSFTVGGGCDAEGYASFAGGSACIAVGNYSRAVGLRAKTRQDAHSALSGGYFNDVGDAQYVKTVLTGNGGAYATIELDTPEAYILTQDSSALVHLYICIRCDDGISAYVVRRLCLSDSAGTLSINNEQTIGTDVDEDAIIDVIDISANGGELLVEIALDYNDDFGAVCKLESVENAFYKEVT